MYCCDRAAEVCFEEIEAEALVHGATSISDSQLLKLQHLYGKNWLTALRIVDDAGVTCYIAHPSGRKSYKVKGKGDHYTVFPHHYCSCQAFFYEVVCKSDAQCCKHQLAARLAAALGKCHTLTISDLAMAQMLMQSAAHCSS